MDLKLYKVKAGYESYYYVLAYSWEHALVLVAEMGDIWPDEYIREDVEEVQKKEYNKILMEYNYIDDEIGYDYIGDYIKRRDKKGLLKHGVLTDDFVNYID